MKFFWFPWLVFSPCHLHRRCRRHGALGIFRVYFFCLTNGFDPRKFEAALPSEEDQKILQAAKGPPVIGAYWRDHELKWIEFRPDSATVSSAAEYLNHRMFVSRDLEPIKDMRVFDQIVLTLHKYRNQFAGVEARTLKRAAADCDWNETTEWYKKKEKDEDEEYMWKKQCAATGLVYK